MPTICLDRPVRDQYGLLEGTMLHCIDADGNDALGQVYLSNHATRRSQTDWGWAFTSVQTGRQRRGSIVLGDQLDGTVPSATLRDIEAELDLGEQIVATAVRDVMFEVLTRLADPTGQARWNPLCPNSRLEVNLRLGGFTPPGVPTNIKREPFSEAAHPFVFEQVQYHYSRREIDRPPGDARLGAYLWARCHKFGVPFDEAERFVNTARFGGPDAVSPEEIHTQFGPDTFGAGGDTDLPASPITWTEVSGDWQTIDSGGSDGHATAVDNARSIARAEHDVGDPAMRAEVDVHLASNTDLHGVLCRMASAGGDDGFGMASRDNAGSERQLWDTAPASLGVESVALTEDEVFRVNADGSDIDGYVDDSLRISGSDGDYSANERGGMSGHGGGGGTDNELDNFMMRLITESSLGADEMMAARQVGGTQPVQVPIGVIGY